MYKRHDYIPLLISLSIFLLMCLGAFAQKENPTLIALEEISLNQGPLAGLEKIETDLSNPEYETLIPEFHFKASYLYLLLGDIPNAEKELNAFLNNGGDQGRFLMRKGTLLIHKGSSFQAEQYLAEALIELKDPLLKGITFAYLANAQRQQKSYDKAHQNQLESGKLLNKYGLARDQFIHQYNLGKSFIALKQLEEGRTRFKTGLAMIHNQGTKQDSLLFLNQLVKVAMEQDDQDSAQYYLNTVLDLQDKKMANFQGITRSYELQIQLLIHQNKSILAGVYLAQMDQFIQSVPAFQSLLRPQQKQKHLALAAQIEQAKYIETQNPENLRNILAIAGKAQKQYYLNFLEKTFREDGLEVLKTHSVLLEMGLSAALKLYEEKEDQSYLIAAWKMQDLAKANLNQKQTNWLIQANRFLSPEEITEWKDLKSSFENERHLSLVHSGRDSSLLGAQIALEQYQLALIDKHPAFKESLGLKPIKVEAIQSKIPEKTALISYYWGREILYTFVLGKSSIFAISNNHLEAQNSTINLLTSVNKMIKIPTEEIEEEIEEEETDIGVYSQLKLTDFYSRGTGTEIYDFNKAIRKMDKHNFSLNSYQLYLRLLSPIRKQLKKKEKLIICPDGPLHYLSFEALISNLPDGDEAYTKFPFLIKDYEISYLPRGGELLKKEKASNYTTYFSGFAPVFDEDKIGYIYQDNQIFFQNTNTQQISLRTAAPNGKNFQPLKYSETEILRSSDFFGRQNVSVKSYLHESATEDNLRLAFASSRIVHIASHSFVNDKNPLLSGIGMAQNQGGDNDGILFVSEIEGLQCEVDLIVLSSCESGLGSFVKGEGLLSLSNAFRRAGAQNIIHSMWKVSDRHTGPMMEDFYQEYTQGKTYAEALRQAKLTMIQQSSTANPRKWASFILTE